MRREERLTKPQQYASVYRQGSSRASNLLVMRALPNGLTLSRFGFSVSKRVGNAVIRNKVKRRLREILPIMSVKSAWDIVFIVRPAAATADYATLKKAVEGLLARNGLLESEAGSSSITASQQGNLELH